MTPCLLVADIGGTNARFALAGAERAEFTEEMTFDCTDFASADLAIDSYLGQIRAPDPSVICIAAAGPVLDGSIRLTNGEWCIDSAELERTFSGARVMLMNDFDAIAHAVPLLGKSDCAAIGPLPPPELQDRDFTVGVIGPGTGLGTAGLCRRGGRPFGIGGEGGHGGFAPETDLQFEMLKVLRGRFDRVTDECLVSGPGVVNIYGALAEIRGARTGQIDATTVFESALDGSDPVACEAVEVFFEVLGQVAGDFVLYLGALEGVYIGGGIARRYPTLLEMSCFRAGFESKGPYRSMMESIPTCLIMHPEPGLLGASYCALQLLTGKM
jgi:glucokinase